MKFSGYMQFNHPDTLKYKKPEVETEIKDGGGGPFGFFKMRLLSQILTDLDKII